MKFVATVCVLLIAVQCAIAAGLNKEQLALWVDIRQTTKAVPHPACASQLYTTFIESDTVLQKDGISPQFIASMDNMISISGDIPEALTVRDKLSSAREYYSASFTTNKLAQFSKQLGSIDG